MAGLHSSIEQLVMAGKNLRQRWDVTKPLWNDQVRQSFEKDYWVPLQAQTQATLKEMEQLSQVLIAARNVP